MCSTTHNAVLIDDDFIGYAKRDNFVANTNGKARKVFSYAVRPFEVDVFERCILAGNTAVFLDRFQFATNGSVDSVLGNNDAPFEPQTLTYIALPEPYGFGVCQRCELVIEENLDFANTRILARRAE